MTPSGSLPGSRGNGFCPTLLLRVARGSRLAQYSAVARSTTSRSGSDKPGATVRTSTAAPPDRSIAATSRTDASCSWETRRMEDGEGFTGGV